MKYLTHVQLIKRESSRHIETSQLICRANQLTVFYIIAALACNELREDQVRLN